jgi:DNA-binding transcriptional MocR family regulator
VIERLQAAKQLTDLHTSALIQAAVHRFCERRLLDRHAVRVVREYRRRQQTMLAALRRRMPAGTTWTEPMGGFSLLLTLPDGMTAARLLPLALQRGVAFTPGEAFFLDGSGTRSLRLSFSAVPSEQIERGVQRLAEAIREALRHRSAAPAREPAMAPVV